jgi:hypothetical protein
MHSQYQKQQKLNIKKLINKVKPSSKILSKPARFKMVGRK